MPWTIYCHTHTESGRRYVGLTKKTVLQRWNQHVYTSGLKSGSGYHFSNAIRKYGKEAFSHEILEVCVDLDVANLAEECWVELLGTRDPLKGFNIAKGGGSKPHSIRKNPWDDMEYRTAQLERFSSPEWKVRMNEPGTKARMSSASRGRKFAPESNPWNNAEFREKGLQVLIARNTSADVRSRISDKLTGRKLSLEHVANSSRALTGKKQSPEHIAKVAAANTGRRHTEEARSRMSAAQSGRKLSPEHIQKIKDRPANPESIAKMLKTRASGFVPKPECKNGHVREGISKSGKLFCVVCRTSSARKRRAKPEVREALRAYKTRWHQLNKMRE